MNDRWLNQSAEIIGLSTQLRGDPNPDTNETCETLMCLYRDFRITSKETLKSGLMKTFDAVVRCALNDKTIHHIGYTGCVFNDPGIECRLWTRILASRMGGDLHV